MARKYPQWRHEMATPGRQLRSYQKTRPLSLPLYVLRWLNVHAVGRQANHHDLAAQIIINACHAHYTVHTGEPKFLNSLLFGKFHAGEEAFYEDVCAELKKLPGHDAIVCIDNELYGYFFSVRESERAEFLEWVWEQWPTTPPKRPGWPVIQLRLGDWPVDPRLLPGTPLALPHLEGGNAAVVERQAHALIEPFIDLDDEIPF